ncbi:MAG: type II secretion system GspH family protein [Caldiserica bacterium]|jgi:prepilin-type N-terminal cleavage/methylation domain-containing protein|nr:type II secretion system GspH family protein [Caldisericota bacterium]MDH7561824.1 type II secretion system protein [Caldisericota bacterium]
MKRKNLSPGFTLTELLVSIAILSFIAVFLIIITAQMAMLTAKTQVKNVALSLAQDKIEELRATLAIPVSDFQEEIWVGQHKYIRVVTSTFYNNYARTVTVTVKGPENLATSEVSLNTLIYADRPQVSFFFPSGATAYVRDRVVYEGTIRDDSRTIPKNQIQYRTSSDKGTSWSTWSPLTELYQDKDCTLAASDPLQVGKTYYFRISTLESPAGDGNTLDIQVKVLNSAGISNLLPSEPISGGPYVRLISDHTKPEVGTPSLSSTPSTISLKATATDTGAGIRDIFCIIANTSTTPTEFLGLDDNGYYWNVEPFYFPMTTSDFLNYKYTITPSALLNNNMPEGTILSIQSLALDRVIGRYYDYETLIPNNGQWFNIYVPSENDYFVWVGSGDKVVKANFNSTLTVTVATPSISEVKAEVLTPTSLALSGTVNPNGLETTCFFTLTSSTTSFTTSPITVPAGYDFVSTGTITVDLPSEGAWEVSMVAQNAVGRTEKESNKDILVVQPNGGEEWHIGETQHISWTTVNVSEINIYISRDGGEFSMIATTSTSSPYALTVTGPASNECYIKVEDQDSSIWDRSDQPIKIFP